MTQARGSNMRTEKEIKDELKYRMFELKLILLGVKTEISLKTIFKKIDELKLELEQIKCTTNKTQSQQQSQF